MEDRILFKLELLFRNMTYCFPAGVKLLQPVDVGRKILYSLAKALLLGQTCGYI